MIINKALRIIHIICVIIHAIFSDSFSIVLIRIPVDCFSRNNSLFVEIAISHKKRPSARWLSRYYRDIFNILDFFQGGSSLFQEHRIAKTHELVLHRRLTQKNKSRDTAQKPSARALSLSRFYFSTQSSSS